MTLNEDIIFSQPGLYRLASHEAYGGHHSELSNKDKLLVEEERGEHGLVITYSPQAFVSEGLAEAVYVLLGILDEKDNVKMLGWQYDRLVYALYNKMAFMHFDDGLSKEEIIQKLGKFGIDATTQKEAINFATDDEMGRYAPVYYSAMNFIINLYNRTSRKEELIKTLFALPCTPKLLSAEF